MKTGSDVRKKKIGVSHEFLRLTPKSLLNLSHAHCCRDTGTHVADRMTEAFPDSPAAWPGLSAACCRGCIQVWLVYLPLGLYDAGC